ncbi:MAG: bifunctional hydroxymethylpyrimidine kinase/phosphomethylpyrimidine kinase [Candidatus Dormibacteria bacterium]
MAIPRCLSIASSDSGGGAGIQADLKAFAAGGCHGMTAVVALTAQNTLAVTEVHEVPPAFVVAQLRAVWDDIGVDAAKTGMLRSRPIIEAVADFLADHRVPLVVDPVMVATTGTVLLRGNALAALRRRLLPLATVVTPNLSEAQVLAGSTSGRRQLAERIHALGPQAVVITGGHGADHSDHFYDGHQHVSIRVEQQEPGASHGSGCTHSAAMTALLAHGESLLDAARGAAAMTAAAIGRGLTEIGAGDGPLDILGIRYQVHPSADAAGQPVRSSVSPGLGAAGYGGSPIRAAGDSGSSTRARGDSGSSGPRR